MTHATPIPEKRHDTLAAVTGKSGRGTARQTIRVDVDLWDRFGTVCEQAGSDRSDTLRAFMRWFAREEGAKMPRRPAQVGDQGEPERSG